MDFARFYERYIEVVDEDPQKITFLQHAVIVAKVSTNGPKHSLPAEDQRKSRLVHLFTELAPYEPFSDDGRGTVEKKAGLQLFEEFFILSFIAICEVTNRNEHLLVDGNHFLSMRLLEFLTLLPIALEDDNQNCSESGRERAYDAWVGFNAPNQRPCTESDHAYSDRFSKEA